MNDQKKSKKVGRPKVSGKQAQRNIITLRFTDNDLKMFRDAAKKKQMTLSKWIREILKTAI